MKTKHARARWAPLLVVAGIVAACGPAVTPTADSPAPAPTPAPTPAPQEPLATCGDSAIRLLDLGTGIHGAIVADTLHMGGAETPVTCAEPANLSLLADLSIPEEWTAQVQQSQYYLIVIRYPDGNRLYVISRRSDGTSCVVDTNDRCIAQVTELPDGFDLDDLPDDVAPTIPAGRPAPPTVSPPPDGGYTPPVVPAPPAASAPATAGNPQPRDGAAGVAVETLLLSWSAATRAASYDVYWGREEHLTADADLGTPIGTTFTATTIRRPALGTTYYWRVDAKNDQGTTTGSVWSFTTADRAAPPPVAPGGGYTPPVVGPGSGSGGETAAAPPVWPESAIGIKVTGYAHTLVSKEIPMPTGYPIPEITAFASSHFLSLDQNSDSLTVTFNVPAVIWNKDRNVVLEASNSEGEARLRIAYRFQCGYTQRDLISFWEGTYQTIKRHNHPRHAQPTPYADSVQFTSSALIINGVSHAYIRGIRRGRNTTWCDYLTVQAPGRTYSVEVFHSVHYKPGRTLYSNIHKGGSNAAGGCSRLWYDAVIRGHRDGSLYIRYPGCP